MKLLSVNVGRATPVPYTDNPEGVTGIDKRPVEGPVRVAVPGPKGIAGSGPAGDAVCRREHHGGDQAVYAVAREDLDDRERELGRSPAGGGFGENLTTQGLDVSGARIVSGGAQGPKWSSRSPADGFRASPSRPTWVRRSG